MPTERKDYEDPYIYFYSDQTGDQKGLSIRRTTSFLVPFTTRFENWEIVYCSAMLGIGKHRKLPSVRSIGYFFGDDEIKFNRSDETVNVPAGGGRFAEGGVWYDNRFAIGLKDDTPNQDIGAASSAFMGMSADPISASVASVYEFGTQDQVRVALAAQGSTGLAFGYQDDSTHSFSSFSSGFINFYQPDLTIEPRWVNVIMRFEIKNIGTSSQTLDIGYQKTDPFFNRSTIQQLMRSGIRNFSPDFQANGISLNDGVNPRKIPNAFYIRWPFTRSELKLHSFLIERQTPSD